MSDEILNCFFGWVIEFCITLAAVVKDHSNDIYGVHTTHLVVQFKGLVKWTKEHDISSRAQCDGYYVVKQLWPAVASLACHSNNSNTIIYK